MPNREGYFYLRNLGTGLFLEGIGNRVFTSGYKANNNNQRWKRVGASLVHRTTGYVLDSNQRGQVYLHSFNGGKWQRWFHI
jgi:hypothetical protein